MEVEAPLLAVGQDAEPNLACGDDVHTVKILEHLRRGNAFLMRVAFVGVVERTAPAFGFCDGEPVLIALGLILFSNGTVAGGLVGKQERIGNMLAPLGREVLLDFDILPAKQLEDWIDEYFLGLRLVGLVDGEQVLRELLESAFSAATSPSAESLPRLAAGDALKQIVACEEITRNHKSGPILRRSMAARWQGGKPAS